MKHVNEHFPDYALNALDRVQRAEVEAHLDECTLCREEYDSLLRLWGKLGGIPEETPGPSMRLRFTTMLEAYQEGSRTTRAGASPLLTTANNVLARLWPSQPVLQFGLAIAFAVVGTIGGLQLTRPDTHDTELSELRSEMKSMGHLLALSLLTQQSASERLRGVSWSSQIDQPDPQITTALLNALRYDPNVNVRLASVDALAKFLNDPLLREEVLDALPDQPSPLVQIALVDVMVDRQSGTSAEALRKLTTDPRVTPIVRQRIEEGLRHMAEGARS